MNVKLSIKELNNLCW